jgi:hypothetical protein
LKSAPSTEYLTRISLNGQDDDEAMLITHNETYLIRRAETSNLLLLAEPSNEISPAIELSPSYSSTIESEGPFCNCNVIDSGNLFLEVLEARPRFDNLLSKLSCYNSSGARGLISDVKSSPSIQEIANISQASQEQLESYFFNHHCVVINSMYMI